MDKYTAISEIRALYANVVQVPERPKSVWLPRESADVTAGLIELHMLNES